MARKKEYSVESIQRALDHHVETGALTSVELEPVALRHTAAARTWHWRVTAYGAPSPFYDLTNGEAHALCVGLAAGERKYGGKDQ